MQIFSLFFAFFFKISFKKFAKPSKMWAYLQKKSKNGRKYKIFVKKFGKSRMFIVYLQKISGERDSIFALDFNNLTSRKRPY